MTLKELNRRARHIDWVKYFQSAFEQIKREINENEPIVVYSPEYMTNLSKLIEFHFENNERKMYSNLVNHFENNYFKGYYL